MLVFKRSDFNDRDFFKSCFSHNDWFSRYCSSNYSEQYLDFLKYDNHFNIDSFVVMHNQSKIGFVNFESVGNLKDKRYSFSGGINPNFLLQGYGRLILRIALQIAFEKFGANRLEAKVLKRNDVMKNMLLKNGFRIEGELIEYEYCEVEEKFIDVFLLSLLKKDFSFNYNLNKEFTYE